MSGFRKFLLRGNVVDLAVAVIIGAAFGTLVFALTKDFITPLIAAIGGKPNFGNLYEVEEQRVPEFPLRGNGRGGVAPRDGDPHARLRREANAARMRRAWESGVRPCASVGETASRSRS